MNLARITQNLVFFTLAAVLMACGGPAIYVSPEGKDAHPGTRKLPVYSLTRAVELNRELKFGKILVQPGEYFDVSVTLTREDSGLWISAVKPGTVKLYGGQILAGWRQQGEWLEAAIPDEIWPELDLRLLIINDSLRPRARLPRQGAFTHQSEWPHQWQSTQGGWSRKPEHDDLTTLKYNPEDIGPWLDTRNAEITVFHAWDDSYSGLSDIDTINNIIRFSLPASHPPGAFASWAGEKTRQYIVWNIKEGMTTPGQWYIDRTQRKILYWPLPGETPENIRALLPTRNFLVKMEENSDGITLENLQFLCAGAPVSNTGYATVNITGAILATKASNLTMKGISVRNVAGWAVKVTGSHIGLEDSEFSHTGAGGVYLTGEKISISRCGIHDAGKLYFGAVGIYGSGNRNLISHCEIFNIPYCAINGIGKRSVAENNLIYNFKQTMVDGGAIYMYGGDSTIYRHNAVLAAKGNKTEGWTYYFDELSVNCVMENNLAVNTIVPMHHHMADRITIRNNLFIDEIFQKLSYPLCSNLDFAGNTLVADEIRFSGPTGEKGTAPRESFNNVFRNYYDANGIQHFHGNQMFAAAVRIDVHHVYNVIRREEFQFPQNNENALLPVTDFRKAIPDNFRETGYRGNFDAVLRMLTEDTFQTVFK